MNERYCADCKHCTDEIVQRCSNPKLGKNLVTGKPIFRSCHDMRYSAESTTCGKQAVWFEPKQKEVA